MKKIYLFLLASASVFAVASCQQAELEEPMPVNPDEVTTLTLAFDATRTTLVDGKTAWVAGDKVRIYNSTGTFYDDVTISEADAGKSSIEIEVNMKDKEYFAVYPVEAANGISEGKIGIKIPSNPDGLFASANICVAQTGEGGTTLRMRNATAILKLKVASGNVVEILQFNAQNPMTGTFTVDLSGEAPVLTMVSGSKAATVAVGGVDGDYYIPVAPGTYAEAFAVTALRGNGGYQTLTSTKANEIAMNTIVDMGSIGDNLSTGLNGEGTEASPYLIDNLGEWGAFTASVNLGNPYTGKFVKLGTDIDEAKTPVGHYYAADEQAAFAGIFLGNDHKITLDMEGENLASQNYVALFGVIDEGAQIKNVKVEGKVVSTGDYAAGLIGYSRGSVDSKVLITDCTSSVKVTTNGARVGGIAGYTTYTDVVNCTNKGEVSGTKTVAGIAGYNYYSTIENSKNEGTIEDKAEAATGMYLVPTAGYSTSDYNNGTGGIVGYAQNSTVKDCQNSGNVSAFIKVGGVAGHTYWTSMDNITNSGVITANGDLNYRADTQNGFQFGSVAGGIVGYVNTQGLISNATNNGVVNGKGGMGGIAGYVGSTNNAQSKPVIQNCTNNANVVATNVYGGGTESVANPGTGGIVGALGGYSTYVPSVLDCVNKGDVSAVGSSERGGHSVGGIVGLSYGGRNTLNGDIIINRCKNEGNVTGTFWVGGILGLTASRYATQTSVLNCSNVGTVTASNAKLAVSNAYKELGAFVGGIVGGCCACNMSYRTRAHLRVNNCYNHGDVFYQNEDIATPFAGGIVGNIWGDDGTKIQNNYNSAYVGPASKSEIPAGALAYVGALAGRQQGSYVHFCYYPKDGLAPVGSNGNAARTDTVVSFDAEGNLSLPVTANNIDCTTLLQVLNEWQNYYVANGYFNWTGPTGKPVHDTTTD